MKKENGFAGVRLMYGVGDFYGGAGVGIVNILFLFFLTNVAMITPAQAAIILFIGGVADAITDPLLGAIGDRTKFKGGRRVPYFLIGAVPVGLSFVLLWMVPGFVPAIKFVYYIFSFVFFSTAMTVVMIPYAALAPELTNDPQKRNSLVSVRMAFSITGALIAAVVPNMIVESAKTAQQGYAVMSFIFSGIFMTIWFGMFLVMRGREQFPSERLQVSFFKSVLQCLSNKGFLFLIFIYMFAFIPNDIISANFKYYLNYYLGMESLFSLVLGLTMVCAVLSLPLYLVVIRKIGKPKALLCGGSFRVLSLTGFLLLTPQSTLPFILLLAVLNGIGTGVSYAVPWALLPEVTDFDEAVTGGRNEGVYAGVMTFMRKISSAAAMLMLGFILQISGYNAEAAVQLPQAVSAIRYSTILLPILFTAITVVLAIKFPITPGFAKKVSNIVRLRRSGEFAKLPQAERDTLLTEINLKRGNVIDGGNTADNRISVARRRAADWLRSMEIEPWIFTNSGYNNPVKYTGMLLPATYNALNALHLLGETENIDKTAISDFFARFQTENGFYRIPEMKPEDIYYPTFEYDDLHITNYTMGALSSLGIKPQKNFAFLKEYSTPPKLQEWLAQRDMQNPWNEGNYIVNLASFFLYRSGQEDTQFEELIDTMIDWHLENQDASGYFHDPSICDLASAMAGAAHNFHIFYYRNLPIPRYKTIIDHCLTLPTELSTACIDVDIVDILSNFYAYNYRRADIKRYLKQKRDAILAAQNPDGGFFDTREGERLFDGWNVYREPQGLSNCFATWFRLIALGMIDCILSPETADAWQFRNTIGIGYFRKDYLKGGFKEPVPRTAKTYASESGETLRQARPCSQELLSLMELSAKKITGSGIDFCCQFHISDDGDFYLTPENGAGILPGIIPNPDVTLELSRTALAGLLSGKTNPTVAYAMRKLKVKGNITLALKLAGLITSDR